MIHPLPTDLIRNFAAMVDRVVVVEELDGIIEQHCDHIGVKVEGKSLFSPIGEYNQEIVAQALGVSPKESAAPTPDIPVRPPVMCAGCPHRGMYYALVKNHVTVLGDIGCYTLGMAAPLNALVRRFVWVRLSAACTDF